MTQVVRENKYVTTLFIVTIIFFGLTLSNLPGQKPTASSQTIEGTTFNYADYNSVDHEQLAIFNYLDRIVTEKPLDDWTDWHAEGFHGLLHYVIAFMAYSVSRMFASTPGYRTDHYRDFAYKLIKKMNTTIDEYGNDSVEYIEWSNPDYGFMDYYWPNATDTNGLYVGGFRGPTNIMFTGHYALMEALYERNFNTGEMTDELSWFVEDWNNSLTTDGYGNPKEGGIWGVGLIPCEPYIVFVQCNSIPILTTELYDNMYGTWYMESGMWEYGLNFINTVMQDEYDLFTDGYYVYEPIGYTYTGEGPPPEFPGHSIRFGYPKVSSYCNGWALNFLDYTQENETIHDYPIYLDLFGKEVSGDKMYMLDTYRKPSSFGTYDILGTLFTMALARQQDDFTTLERLNNFMFSIFNKVWSEDNRMMHYDTMSLIPFLQIPLSYAWIWAMAPATIKDMAESHPEEFWGYPYISAADDEYIWVYQAEWDPDKSGFVLSIQVDQEATLTFSNFAIVPTAYSTGVSFADLIASGDDCILTLQPGTYQLVIK
jgi:hypothetical protein